MVHLCRLRLSSWTLDVHAKLALPWYRCSGSMWKSTRRPPEAHELVRSSLTWPTVHVTESTRRVDSVVRCATAL
ncbi:hypothetical protein ABB07_38605 [Streptomyces incarnatus]|uniref:Transposase n=1 Tax=Streptomyces incarnatus TaxID=665007 RepID=A0ABM5TXS5_9ACTN|nr:hypothetical protein ABB07_38605 [Streptomyces incarnatus]